MSLLGFVLFLLFGLCFLGVFLMASHHQPGAPWFGSSETRTAGGWKFTNSDGSIVEVNGPNLSASQARAMANFARQPTTGNQNK